MITGIINQEVSDYFTIVDGSGDLITGVDSTEFTVYLYNPDDSEVSSSLGYTIEELSQGNYKISFTPDINGLWYLMIIHPTYFPWGKTDDIQISNGDLTTIYDNVQKSLGLAHHNVYIDNPLYDDYGNMTSARVRIYSDAASVGSDLNVIETYLIASDGTECGQFSYWSQVTI